MKSTIFLTKQTQKHLGSKRLVNLITEGKYRYQTDDLPIVVLKIFNQAFELIQQGEMVKSMLMMR